MPGWHCPGCHAMNSGGRGGEFPKDASVCWNCSESVQGPSLPYGTFLPRGCFTTLTTFQWGKEFENLPGCNPWRGKFYRQF
eukprot:g33904.t1